MNEQECEHKFIGQDMTEKGYLVVCAKCGENKFL